MDVIKSPRRFARLGVLILDGSGSMGERHPLGISKAEAISQAVRDLITALKNHRDSRNFLLTTLVYDDEIYEPSEQSKPPLVPVTWIEELDEYADYNPLRVSKRGQTAIGDALQKGFEIAHNFVLQPGDYPPSAVIILMTDGKNNAGRDPLEVSREIHERIKNEGLTRIRRICTLGFGDPADQESLDTELLKAIATRTDPEILDTFFVGQDIDKVVGFFFKSVVA